MPMVTNQPSRVPTSWDMPCGVQAGWMQQFRYFVRLYDMVRGLDGDVVECGLGKGDTFTMLAYLVGSEGRQPARGLWGFDSFAGWPAPDSSDVSPRSPKEGEWTVCEEMVWQRLADSKINHFFPELDIQIKKGFLRETLLEFPDRPIAFLHLDVDLYEGYRDGLKHLFLRVVPGGIVAVDEYREFHPELPDYVASDGTLIEKWPGCSKAIDEHFRTRPQEMHYHPETGKYFIVKDRFLLDRLPLA